MCRVCPALRIAGQPNEDQKRSRMGATTSGASAVQQ